jgi:hypothetical protein
MSEPSKAEPASPAASPESEDLRQQLDAILREYPWGRDIWALIEDLGKTGGKSNRDIVPVERDDLAQLVSGGWWFKPWARTFVMTEILKHPGGLDCDDGREMLGGTLVESIRHRRTDENLAGVPEERVRQIFDRAIKELLEAGRIVVRGNLAFAAEFALAPAEGEQSHE